MRVDLVLVCVAAVALSLPSLSTCDPLFVMSAPNLLRVATTEKVFVEAQDYSGEDVNVHIRVMDYPKNARELTSTSVTLTKANEFMLLADITIPHGKEHFEEDITLNQYVYLQAQFPGHLLQKVVLVSFQSGYIFVQTDKTIYTPSSTVMYRVFSLNPTLEPVESGISVEIMTPQGIIIEKEDIYSKGGLKSGDHKLTDLVSFGTWKLITRFVATPQRNFTAEFEVKEYVLPSFEVSLTPGKAFFYVDDDHMNVDIVARYLYGKDVTGVAFVTFGVTTQDDQKRSLSGSLQRVEIREGKGEARLEKMHITQTFPDINQLVGSSIYVSVSVLTDTGSEMVEAQKRGIPIVKSPYTIHFKKTPKYFKPGMPFDVSVFVTNPDNSPANEVELEVMAEGLTMETSTGSNGMAKASINTKGGTDIIDIDVRTKDPRLTDARQATGSMKAHSYKTKGGSNNYLHIDVDAANVAIGDNVKIKLILGASPGAQNQDFTFLILNKGQLVQAKRFKRQGQAIMVLPLPVTKDMIPSFRIVAYYHVGSSEVVSDSVWVDVKDTCIGTLKVEPSRPKNYYSPREPFGLKITGDPGARLGLVAVDKGVYVLNNKHRLTQTKIWDVIERYDTGCTAGSGENSMGVFYDAGLIFESSTAGGTESRQEPTCPTPAKRRRRAITIQDLHNSLTAKYSDPAERQCCVDGMKDNVMGFTCERRAEYITEGDKCVKAFKHCCKEIANQKKDTREEHLFLARSEVEDDYYTDSEDIVSRSQFPESWLWEDDENLPKCPAHDEHCTTTELTKRSFMRDSITSWQVTAISISKTHGICVADPYEMIVIKDFFIDLKLPYSVVRNEQIEIKAILYNYNDYEIKVRVELLETPDVCSVATKKGKYRTTIEMDPMTSRAIPYVIIPMQLGKHSIEVKGAVYDSHLTDGVKKDLLVVSEGIRTEVPVKRVILKPSEHGGIQIEKIQSQLPERQVPGTPAKTYISVAGNQISPIIEKAITGESLGSFIQQPGGCGEQNMIRMTMPLIATHYLDTTKQWENVGLQNRDTAINYINMGYRQELAYRRNDGAFAVFADGPGRAWLTAYVAKGFAMASDLINIDERVICEALRWLVLNSQQPDGMFRDPASAYHRMMLDVSEYNSDASLTAYVLIAMQEARRHCIESVASLPDSIKKATEYLEGRLQTLTNPYAVAIVSYALANEEKLNQDILFQHSKDGTHWPVKDNDQFTKEATGYALLALVKANEFEKAGPIVRWLNIGQSYEGNYGSTQSSMIVFQSVAAYSAQVKGLEQNLKVELDVSGRSKPVKWTFNKGNAFLTRSDKIDINQNLTVNASGNGEGTLSVMTLYYAKPSEINKECKKFDLEVKMEKQNRVTYQGASETYLLTIEFLYLSKDHAATMSVLDIGLLTGFVVDETDLTSLSTGVDRYIQKFEMDKVLSDRGSLIIYLDKISNRRAERVTFRIHKIMDVGLLQPAGVSVYEYLDMDNRCVRFYHPKKKEGELNRICHKDICKCAEESCCKKKAGAVDIGERSEKACEAGIDYVYKVTVERILLTLQTDTYYMKISQVIKEGTDFGVDGETREFIAHPNCRETLALEEGKTYLLMGHRDDVIPLEGSFRYLMGHATWLEYWPTEAESQSPEYGDAYIAITQLAQELTAFGCGM